VTFPVHYLLYICGMEKIETLIYWIVRLVAAIIMVQTLYFKFTGAEESIYIFTKIHMEPWGRISVGIFELIASVLLIFNATAWIGAVFALGLMGGAIMMHLTILGIEVQDDGGYLFLLALVVSVCAVVVLFFNKKQIMDRFKTLASR
jgi:putative oxidoreductase